MLGFGEPATPQFLSWNTRKIWLDFQYGSALEHVEAANAKPSSIAAKQFNDRETNWIGATRGTSGKDPVGAIVDRWIADQFESVGPIENPEHDQVREAFYVGESGLKLRQDF